MNRRSIEQKISDYFDVIVWLNPKIASIVKNLSYYICVIEIFVKNSAVTTSFCLWFYKARPIDKRCQSSLGVTVIPGLRENSVHPLVCSVIHCFQ